MVLERYPELRRLMSSNTPQNIFATSRNVFGPVSMIPAMGLLNRPSQKDPEIPEEIQLEEEFAKEKESEHRFLMENAEKSDAIEEITQESLEVLRAQRAEFVQMLTLATIQGGNFSTII